MAISKFYVKLIYPFIVLTYIRSYIENEKMKASEILKRYAEGERNFQKVNLRGQSFKGENLSGADFSKSDIRGVNFSEAILRGTRFSKAKAGLKNYLTIMFILLSWEIILILGMGLLKSIFLVALVLDSGRINNFIISIIFLLMFVVLLRSSILKILIIGFGTITTAMIVVGIMLIAGAGSEIVISMVHETVMLTVIAAMTIAGTAVTAMAIAVVGILGEIIPVAITIGMVLAIVGAGVVVVGRAGVFEVTVVVAVVEVFLIFGTYIGWRAIKGDLKDNWIRTFAVAIASLGGTSFYNADLTDADFTGATLKNTDLRAKNFTRVCWKDTIKLDFARVGKTLLAQSEVRELLVTGNGYNKSYIHANLRGAYLVGANLNKANLKYADLSEATLAGANLNKANLREVNAIGTDFTHSYMTGACIEAWNIDRTTKLKGVDCQFIYLLEYPQHYSDDRERRPSSGNFQPGEFTKLFEHILDTVDLIFREAIDWKAFVAAYKKIKVENEDTLLEIQSIEDKRDGVIVVKVKVPLDTDKEKIHQDLIENYQLAIQAIEEKYKTLLEAEKEQIEAKKEQIEAKKEQIEAYKERIELSRSQIKTLQEVIENLTGFQLLNKSSQMSNEDDES